MDECWEFVLPTDSPTDIKFLRLPSLSIILTILLSLGKEKKKPGIYPMLNDKIVL